MEKLKTRLAVSTALAFIIALGAPACGGSEGDAPPQTTVINEQEVELEDNGAIEVDGIFYLKGEAYKKGVVTNISEDKRLQMSVRVRYRCIGLRLQTISSIDWGSGAGSSTDTTPNDPACLDGKIEVGELTKLPS